MGIFFMAATAHGQGHTATITRLEGSAQVLRWPSPGKPKGPKPHVLFEGKHYSVSEAYVGQKVMVGSVLRTFKDGKLRLTYDNGDQLNLAPDTHLQISRNQDKSVMDVMFGEIRATIQKGGPNKELEVKTPSSVMGVRGTDFHFVSSTSRAKTDLTVITGAVAFAKAESGESGNPAKSEPVTIPAGFTAQIAPPTKEERASDPKAQKPSPSGIALFQSSKNQLSAVQEVSEIKKPDAIQLAKAQVLAQKEVAALRQEPAAEGGEVPEAEPEQAKDPTTMQTQLAALEKASKKVVLDEIRESDPVLFEKLASSDLDQIQQGKVEAIKTTAPSEPLRVKPSSLPSYRKDIYKER
jgi:hypothetical protein